MKCGFLPMVTAGPTRGVAVLAAGATETAVVPDAGVERVSAVLRAAPRSSRCGSDLSEATTPRHRTAASESPATRPTARASRAVHRRAFFWRCLPCAALGSWSMTYLRPALGKSGSPVAEPPSRGGPAEPVYPPPFPPRHVPIRDRLPRATAAGFQGPEQTVATYRRDVSVLPLSSVVLGNSFARDLPEL